MKKLFILLGLVLLVLVAIVLVRTFSFKEKVYAPAESVEAVNADPKLLSGALQFETISHKKGMIDDSAFSGFHNYLKSAFPLIDSFLERETVSKYSLIYKWEGKNPELQPLVLMAHQDVVPVEYSSRNQWDFEPFSGRISDDGFIYGRGTLDDKGSLVSIIAATEFLLAKDFQPKRTIYICLGHDEEIGGAMGAKKIAERLEQRGVKAWMVLDEGGTLATGLVPGINKTVALIGISEKGYMSLALSADIPGGHSSMPEPKNALEAVNRAVFKLKKNPLPNRISPPIEGFINHIGPQLPFVQKMAFANVWLFKPLIFSTYEKSAAGAALIHTTQTATVFNSGIKDNIVPTRASAIVNYRLLPGDEPEEIIQKVKETIDDEDVKVTVHEDLAIPASPISDFTTEQFELIAANVLAVNGDVAISPYLVLGATDARHFYGISDQVFRFSPVPIAKEDLPRIHGINERIGVDAFRKCVDFYASLMAGQ